MKHKWNWDWPHIDTPIVGYIRMLDKHLKEQPLVEPVTEGWRINNVIVARQQAIFKMGAVPRRQWRHWTGKTLAIAMNEDKVEEYYDSRNDRCTPRKPRDEVFKFFDALNKHKDNKEVFDKILVRMQTYLNKRCS